jgi:hypothetical protein
MVDLLLKIFYHRCRRYQFGLGRNGMFSMTFIENSFCAVTLVAAKLSILFLC